MADPWGLVNKGQSLVWPFLILHVVLAKHCSPPTSRFTRSSKKLSEANYISDDRRLPPQLPTGNTGGN